MDTSGAAICNFFKNRWVLVAVLILFIMAKIPYLVYPYYWDESWPYVPAILEMAKHGPSLLPASIDPNLSRGHPLFFHAAGAIWVDLFGKSHTSLHSFALFISCLFLATVYEAGYRIFNRRVGILALLLVATNVFFFVQSTFVLFEILVAFLSFLSLYTYVSRQYVLATLSLTALFLTKESGLIAGFVIGLDALFSLANWNEPPKTRIFRLLPVTVACIAIGLFFVLQKHFCGWYVLPLYSETILHKWPDILYRFRTASLRTTFYYGYQYWGFFAVLLLGVVVFFKTRKAGNLRLLLLVVPTLLTYYLIEDSRSANMDLATGISVIACYVICYVATLLSYADVKYYENKIQSKFIMLTGFFVLCYMVFSSVAYFIPRYLLASIIPSLFLLAVMLDMAIRQTYKWLYYPALAMVAVIALFSFRDDRGWTDANLGFKYGVKAQLAVVEYLERSNFYDKNIATASYLEKEHLTDRNTGFLSSDHTFSRVTNDIDSTTDLVLFDNIEPDDRYNLVLHAPAFELLYHIEMHGVWADIFRRKQAH